MEKRNALRDLKIRSEVEEVISSDRKITKTFNKNFLT